MHAEAHTFVDTAQGEAKVFHLDAPVAGDPYLADAGWFYQAMDVDDPPNGPHPSREEAEEEAVVAYGPAGPAIGR